MRSTGMVAGVVWLGMLAGCSPAPRPQGSCADWGWPGAGTQLAVEGIPASLNVYGILDSCPLEVTAEVEVHDPDGGLVPSSHAMRTVPRRHFSGEVPPHAGTTNPRLVRAATVEFTPTWPGRWLLSARFSTDYVGSTEVLVVPAREPRSSVVTRFVDPMDTCVRGPFRAGTLTLCQRDDGQVWAYDDTGAIVDHYPGGQLAVRGDEVWSLYAGDLEHRTALGTSLRLDGSVMLVGDGAEGVTQPGRAVRGELNRVLEISWDGGMLAQRTLGEGYPLAITPANGGVYGVVDDPIEMWWSSGCLFASCGQAVCDSRSCISGFATGPHDPEDDALWRLLVAPPNDETIYVNALGRPLDLATSRAVTTTLWFDLNRSDIHRLGGGRTFMVERMRVASVGEAIVMPHLLDGGTIEFEATSARGTVRTATDEWIIGQGEDAFTLVATPVPPRR